MKKLIAVFLLLCSFASAQAATYTKVIVTAQRNGNTLKLRCRVLKDGVTSYDTGEHFYVRDAGNETLIQFRNRVVAAEKATLDAEVEREKAADLAEGTNSDESANLNAITQ